ncbi:unnamed protein product [Gordionus sp. m RMFG-2023]
MKPLDLISSINVLKNHGVGKIYRLKASIINLNSDSCVFVVKPSNYGNNLVIKHLKNISKDHQYKKFSIIYIPGIDYTSELYMENEGIWELFSHILQFPYYLVPIDKDLFSMENDFFYKDVFIEMDDSYNINIVKALNNIQQSFYCFQEIHVFGKVSQQILSLLKVINSRDPVDEHREDNSDIPTLILFDRTIDIITPLVTSLNYQNLLDETYNINSGFIEIPQSLLSKKLLEEKINEIPFNTPSTSNFKIRLSNDLVFQEIKDSHFSIVSEKLKEKSHELQISYEKGQTSLTGIKDFIAKHLKNVKNQQKSLALHISICESIIQNKADLTEDFHQKIIIEQNILQNQENKLCWQFFDELLLKKSNPHTILAIVSLYCLMQDGLNNKDYTRFQKDFLHIYGYEFITAFYMLTNAKLLYEKSASLSSKFIGKLSDTSLGVGGGSNWANSVIKKLSENVEENESSPVNIKNPCKMSYAYNGVYEPISTNLISNALNGNQQLIEEVMKLIPEGSYQKIRNPFDTNIKRSTNHGGKKVLVFFIGGCTHGEISTIRLLSKQIDREISIATTSTLNARKFISALIE